MAKKFRIDHVAKTPRGWQVRTVTQGDHQVRIAFPPGRRQQGSGHVVEILHPVHENPSYCPGRSRMTNPAELVLMGNPMRRPNQFLADVAEYAAADVAASDIEKSGKHRNPGSRFAIRWHTGNISHAMRSESEARKLLAQFHGKGEIIRVNPLPLRRRNPAVEEAREIREGFTHSPSNRCTVMDEPHMPAGDYAELGKLVSLIVKPTPSGRAQERQELDFERQGVAVVSDVSRHQIYFAGGDQHLEPDEITLFASQKNGVVELGPCREIVYLAAKYHPEVGNSAAGKKVEWAHRFGEESGIEPTLCYNAELERLILRGGTYRVEDAGIVD
jgi:hypothetical protein